MMSTQSLEAFDVQSKDDFALFDESQTNEWNRSPSPRSINCQANYYKVQINLRNYTCSVEKNELFSRIGEKNVQCIVSHEKNITWKSRTSSEHVFKILLNTKRCKKSVWNVSMVFDLVNTILRDIVGNKTWVNQDFTIFDENEFDYIPEITVSLARNLKEAIAWATTDLDAIYSSCFKPSDFSLDYKIERWARENIDNKFNEHLGSNSKFARENKNIVSMDYLKSYLEEYQSKNRQKHKLLTCLIGPFDDWRERVRIWWNNWAENGWNPYRNKHLLIVDPHRHVDTIEFVKYFLFRHADQGNEIPRNSILFPYLCRLNAGNSYYCWDRANMGFHVVVFLAHFNWNCFNVDTLQTILEGREFDAKRKYSRTSQNKTLKIPSIFVCSQELPDTINGKSTKFLKNCFEIIKISEKKQTQTSSKTSYYQMFKAHNLCLKAMGYLGVDQQHQMNAQNNTHL